MRAVAISEFHDGKENIVYKPGDEFDVSKERFDEMNAIAEAQGFGRIVNEVRVENLSPKGKEASRRSFKPKQDAEEEAGE